MARVISFGNGTTEISFLESLIVWMSKFSNFGDSPAIFDEDSWRCRFCDGSGEGIENNEPILCICHIYEHAGTLQKAIELFGSAHAPRPWSNIKTNVSGTEDAKSKFVNHLEYIHQWTRKLSRWLVISGGYGTSKTTILSAIATELHPYALYVDSADFEQRVFDALNHKEDKPNINDLVTALSQHPVLLVDDLGAEYSSRFPKSVLANIINKRYNFSEEYITVVTTNLTERELRRWDERMSDRLLDVHISAFISFTHDSWRKSI